MPKTVNVGRLGNRLEPYAIDDEGTVGDALEAASISDDGHQLRINGDTVSREDSIRDGDTLVVVPNAKGGFE